MGPTKENIECCNRLLKKFQGLRYFNTLPVDYLQELHQTLLEETRDQEHAELIVRTWNREHSEYPTVADICRVARELNPNQAAVTLPAPCPNCQAFAGYVLFDYTVKSGVFAGETRSALALCSCPRGAAMREAAIRVKKERPSTPDFTRVGDLIE